MNNMNEKYRYRSYHATKNYQPRRHDDDFQRRYKHHQYSSSHDNRLRNNNQMNISNQRSNEYQFQSVKSNTYSDFPASSPLPLMSIKPGSSSAMVAAVPHERESWIRSVKKTKVNESTEQKTQYLETMLRMPQQAKSSMDFSTFDRMRFSDDSVATTTNPMEINNFDGNSFHLITDINNYEDIGKVDKTLFDSALQTTTEQCSNAQSFLTPPPSVVDCQPVSETNLKDQPYSGFLIDNCDDTIQYSPVNSPTRFPPITPSTTEQPIENNKKNLKNRCTMLINEFNAADFEQRKNLKRQKRLRRKFRKKNNQSKDNDKHNQSLESRITSTTHLNKHQELSSSQTHENDLVKNNQISQLVETVRKASITMNDLDKVAQVNVILEKIKRQQIELQLLRQTVLSVLGEKQNQNITDTTWLSSNIDQDILMSFIDQPILSGCWLCSGKTYTEVATQCNNTDE